MRNLWIVVFFQVLACSAAGKGADDGGTPGAPTGDTGATPVPGCDNFGGTYSLKYRRLSGTCAESIPDGIAVITPPSVSDAGTDGGPVIVNGCIIHKSEVSKSDKCAVNTDVECYDNASNLSNRTQGVIKASDGGAKAVATVQISIYDDSGVKCLGSYEITYTQLSD